MRSHRLTRIHLAALLALLAAASPAAADGDGVGGAELAELGELLFGAHRATPWHWWLAAEVGASGRGSHDARASTVGLAIDAGVDAAYEYGRFSSRAATGATAELRVEPNVGPVGLTHWALVRPYEVGVLRLELDHELTLEGRPSLSRRPDLWRRSYTREHVGVTVTGLHYLGDHLGAELLRIAEGFDFTWQRDAGARTSRFGTTSDWTVLSLLLDPGAARDVARLDLLSLEAEAIDDERDAVVFSTMYVRLESLPLGPLPLAVDVAWGQAATGYNVLRSRDFEKVILTEDLPDVSGLPVWRGRVHGAIGDLVLSAAAARELFLTMDVDLALERRIDARAAWERGAHRVSATAFRAETRLWTDADTSSDWTTGGGALRYWRRHHSGWSVGASGELARSFYADLEGDRAPRVGDALRLGVHLSRAVGGGNTVSPPATPARW